MLTMPSTRSKRNYVSFELHPVNPNKITKIISNRHGGIDTIHTKNFTISQFKSQ